MPNITLNISNQTYRNARIWCAQNDTSMSRAVQEYLERLINNSAGEIADCHCAMPQLQPAATRNTYSSRQSQVPPSLMRILCRLRSDSTACPLPRKNPPRKA